MREQRLDPSHQASRLRLSSPSAPRSLSLAPAPRINLIHLLKDPRQIAGIEIGIRDGGLEDGKPLRFSLLLSLELLIRVVGLSSAEALEQAAEQGRVRHLDHRPQSQQPRQRAAHFR